MHFYLVRHAHALPGHPDASRLLSDEGLSQIKAVGRLLRNARAVRAKEIWHSPLVRSRDTAVLLAKRLRVKARRRQVDGLRPSDDPEIIARRLGELRHPVIVVGHDPHLSALATLLVTRKADPLRFNLKKCAVLRLDREDCGWTVRWHVSPEVAD